MIPGVNPPPCLVFWDTKAICYNIISGSRCAWSCKESAMLSKLSCDVMAIYRQGIVRAIDTRVSRYWWEGRNCLASDGAVETACLQLHICLLSGYIISKQIKNKMFQFCARPPHEIFDKTSLSIGNLISSRYVVTSITPYYVLRQPEEHNTSSFTPPQ